MADRPVSARELLERGAYGEAAEAFFAVGEYASAARAFVCDKEFRKAAQCYVKAGKPLDAARLFMLTKDWKWAADLYSQAGDSTRAELALQQLRQEAEAVQASRRNAAAQAQAAKVAAQAKAAPPPKPEENPFPPGEIWRAIKAGDYAGAAQMYLRGSSNSGWLLLDEARAPHTLKPLGETLFQARDYAVAAEAFRRAGDVLRSAQCLSLAGLNEEAAHFFMQCGQKTLAAQHLEKAHAWEQAADIYRAELMFLEAARCLERGDDPVRAAALYLKAKRHDLALPLLQAIPPHHRQFPQCRLLAGKILLQKGQKDLALTLLAPLLSKEVKTDEEQESYYQLALLLEQAGETDRARQAYGHLQSAHFDYKDVTARLTRLGAVGPAAAPGATPPSRPAAQSAPKGASRPEPPSPPDDARPAAAASSVDLTPLENCSLFHRLDLDALRRLWAIGRVRECAPGAVLLNPGESSEGLYIVLAGGLTITPDPADLDLAVGFLGTGDYVGLGCLVQGPPRANALVAQGDTRLLHLPAKDLEALFSTETDLGMNLFRSIAEHLSQTLMAQQKR